MKIALASLLLLAACVSTKSATDDRASAMVSTRHAEAERATTDTRVEGPVTVTTTVVEEAVCPGPTCPFPAEYWLPATSTVALASSTPVPVRPAQPAPRLVTRKTTIIVEQRGPVTEVKTSTSTRDAMTVASSTAHEDKKSASKTDVGFSWKAWLIFGLVAALALYLAYRWLPKLPWSK